MQDASRRDERRGKPDEEEQEKTMTSCGLDADGTRKKAACATS
jgi:hypothetical protein